MSSMVTVDIFVSVDGFAGSDGLPGYFGYLGPDLEEAIRTGLAEPHAILMGRRTYEMLAALPQEAHGESWDRIAEVEKLVFSRTLASADWPNTRVVAGDLVQEVTAWRAGSHPPLRTMGSMSLARQLLAAGLVDRLRLTVFPLIAGEAGREPFFADATAADLELAGVETLDGRILRVDYRPTGRDIPRA